ncbi:MAG: glycerophosphodiester phosphodiesterase family protein [Candidatus Saccharimonas sp.]
MALPTLSGYLNYGKLANVTATAGDTAHAITFNPIEVYAGGVTGNALTVGDWMVVIMTVGTTLAGAQTPTASAGWTNLVPFAQVGSGTMCFGVWAKQRQVGETTYNWTINADTGHTNSCVYQTLWFSGADDISNWLTGTFANRQTNGTTTTTVAPAITTNHADSYVLHISGERTVAAETEPQITVSGTGFSKVIHSAPFDLTVTCSARSVVTSGTNTGTVTTSYPNTHNYNGIAGLIAIPAAPPAPTGLQVKLSDGAALQTAYMKVSDGGGTLATPGGLKVVKPGYSTVTAMLASNPFYVAHRGGSRDFPEMSLYAYGQSVLRGYGAIELSLARTSDGVWFGLHDADINRTSGTTGLGAASTMTWAQVQGYQILGSMAANNTSQPNRPYMRFEELMAMYYPSHVIFVDIKYANAYRNEFVTMLNALPGTPQDHIVGKAYGVGASFPTAMSAAGYKTWGYFYESDYTGGQLAANYSYWDILGMDYGASAAAWTAVTGYSKPVIGHICPTVTAKNTAISYGAVGVMCSGALAIIPTTPYSNN